MDWVNISLKDLAGYVFEELEKRGVDTVLVGGACVTIYSENRYPSYDLDCVTYEDMRKVKKALAEIGFIEKSGYFRHEGCQWFVELDSSPVAVGIGQFRSSIRLRLHLAQLRCYALWIV